MPLNFEFKARSKNNKRLEEKLQAFHPQFIGEDLQRDTYYHVPYGRLKLREGNIENALIHYHRENNIGPKQSRVLLYQHGPDENLQKILSAALGAKVVVEKKRRIWFVDTIKFHFDEVEHLGEFVEVEAIDQDGSIGVEKLKDQCFQFAALFEIDEEEYIAESYSDMLLKQTL